MAMTRKIAFSSPTSTDDESTTLFTSFQSAGYDGLQLKYAQYKAYLDEPLRFIEEWGHLPGVGAGLIAGGVLDEANLQLLRKTFGFAKSIGSEIIVFCHLIPRVGITNEDIQKYAVILSELGREAQQQGLKLSLHHHHNQPVMHRTDFDIFFDQVKDQSIGLTVDTAHLVKSGIHDISEIIHSYKHHIDNFHLKDFDHGDWKVLGKGGIPFSPIFQAIKDINYGGWISADEESGGELHSGMNECIKFIKNGLSN